MRAAYVDLSCQESVPFGEPGGRAMARRLRTFDELVAANLLEAEVGARFEERAGSSLFTCQ